ncbi:hypothetical protein N7509_012120 [Penicillium cosmopolitanum]|uniref:Peptidase S1 domain-containing protein n=1 Tax=Penicillium cosmopolitanum TaxID=1131564 RepID=A0A9W9VGY3_9EURO|nr:uncharacterized protein N7509_012120 [Penicillium cosmopolitanum]KAJ5379001.1 hypothetical protein N7509_012120 [Penicillium cosmopolitanum]
MKLSLLITFLAASVKAQFEKRVVGGSNAAAGEFSYQVSVYYGTSHECGGSIIDSRHVLTAAQCIFKPIASRFKVRVGSTKYISGGKSFQVSKITQHSDYNADTFDNDIAILELQDNLEFGPNVAAVELPFSEQDTPETGAKCSVTGWGYPTHGAGHLTADLRFVYLDIVDHETCLKAYDSTNLKVNDKSVCAGVPGSSGAKGLVGGGGILWPAC